MIFFESERAFTSWLLSEARARGWLACHFGNSMKNVRRRDGGWRAIPDKDAAGFVDVVLVRDDVLLFAELKFGKNRPTAAQLAWIDALRAAGQTVHVWRDHEQDEIIAVLNGFPLKAVAHGR